MVSKYFSLLGSATTFPTAESQNQKCAEEMKLDSKKQQSKKRV